MEVLVHMLITRITFAHTCIRLGHVILETSLFAVLCKIAWKDRCTLHTANVMQRDNRTFYYYCIVSCSSMQMY